MKMQKMKRVIKLALISMLMGALVRPDFAYAQDMSLRVPASSQQQGFDGKFGALYKRISGSEGTDYLIFTPEPTLLQSYRDNLEQFVILLKSIKTLREGHYPKIFDSWLDFYPEERITVTGPVIDLEELKKWYSKPFGPVTPDLFNDQVYALTRILIMYQVPIRTDEPAVVGTGSKYYYWTALPKGFFEEVFDPLAELLDEVLSQLQKNGEVRINISQDKQGQRKVDILRWILQELIVPRQFPAGVARDNLDKSSLGFSDKARLDAEDYYLRLGLTPGLSYEYHQGDWEELVRLTCIRLLDRVENKELITDPSIWLRDPVLRAHYDHHREFSEGKKLHQIQRSMIEYSL